jgi:hypothetical protein
VAAQVVASRAVLSSTESVSLASVWLSWVRTIKKTLTFYLMMLMMMMVIKFVVRHLFCMRKRLNITLSIRTKLNPHQVKQVFHLRTLYLGVLSAPKSYISD